MEWIAVEDGVPEPGRFICLWSALHNEPAIGVWAFGMFSYPIDQLDGTATVQRTARSSGDITHWAYIDPPEVE